MYIWDLENTITNSNHRQHFADEKNWDEFHSWFPYDLPRWNNINLLRACAKIAPVYIITGMMEKHREMAEIWLKKHNVVVDAMYMRDNNDFNSSPIYKLRTISRYRMRPFMTFDDRVDVVSAFLDAGIPSILLTGD
jgi:hypothetical protein